MTSSDDPTECPLCMELLEVDDISFYPCTCGYQICRFCWHRLKTDGNGLCPACRKPYSDNPAHFEPLSEDEIVRIKKERRQKEVQKKQKLTENRRHLADVRVVQKNLVFVVGLSQRLADMEVLKKNEYFGKFGKILKVVVNPSPSYAGTQTPSASAYITYSKPEEALRAIQTVNNIQIDNRTLKASLGTTKYCSHFLKSISCPKADCMYLHDFGEEAASFTKEEMSSGKHLEYESKLIETFLHIPRNLQNISNDPVSLASSNQISTHQIKNHVKNNKNINIKKISKTNLSSGSSSTASTSTNRNTNDATQFNGEGKPNDQTSTQGNTLIENNNLDDEYEVESVVRINSSSSSTSSSSSASEISNTNNNNNINSNNSEYLTNIQTQQDLAQENTSGTNDTETTNTIQTNGNSNNETIDYRVDLTNIAQQQQQQQQQQQFANVNPYQIQQTAAVLLNHVNINQNSDGLLNLKSNNSEETNNVLLLQQTQNQQLNPLNLLNQQHNNHLNNINHLIDPSLQDNLTNHPSNKLSFHEEDLGFDPWGESTRALQDLMQIEKNNENTFNHVPNNQQYMKPVHQQQQQQQQQHIAQNPANMFNNLLINNNLNGLGYNKNLLSHLEFIQKHLNGGLIDGVNGSKAILDFNNKKLNSETDQHGQLAAGSSSVNPNNSSSSSNSSSTTINAGASSSNQTSNQKIDNSTTKDNLGIIINDNSRSINNINNNVKQQLIKAPPGFNVNAAPSTNGKYQLSSSSSSSSASSSVNNSASSTPAINNTTPPANTNNLTTNMNHLNNHSLLNPNLSSNPNLLSRKINILNSKDLNKYSSQSSTNLENLENHNFFLDPHNLNQNHFSNQSSKNDLNGVNKEIDFRFYDTKSLNNFNNANMLNNHHHHSNHNNNSNQHLNMLKDLSSLNNSLNNLTNLTNLTNLSNLTNSTNNLNTQSSNLNNGSLDQTSSIFSKNLLKSIFPNANISFGSNNLNTSINNNNLNLNLNRLSQPNIFNDNSNKLTNGISNGGSNYWPDDPAIISLTDASSLLAVTNNNQSVAQSNNNNNNNSNLLNEFSSSSSSSTSSSSSSSSSNSSSANRSISPTTLMNSIVNNKTNLLNKNNAVYSNGATNNYDNHLYDNTNQLNGLFVNLNQPQQQQQQQQANYDLLNANKLQQIQFLFQQKQQQQQQQLQQFQFQQQQQMPISLDQNQNQQLQLLKNLYSQQTNNLNQNLHMNLLNSANLLGLNGSSSAANQTTNPNQDNKNINLNNLVGSSLQSFQSLQHQLLMQQLAASNFSSAAAAAAVAASASSATAKSASSTD